MAPIKNLNIIIAPGAFKHSLSADKVAHAIQRGLMRSGISATYHLLPIADGGNGTLDAFLANGGTRLSTPVLDPLGRHISADWGILPDGETAIIEMALASGLELLTADELDPLRATTYGTGQLMTMALERGIKRLIIGMGGSATVDGGAGCLMALGVGLHDGQGKPIGYGGGALADIASITTHHLDPRWHDVEILVATDVDNPPLGEQGASAVFAPQKGASPAQVGQLEASLTHFFTQVQAQLGVDVRHVTGGGAAGALAGGLMAFLNARLISGIDLMLAHSGFANLLPHADLVVTGEGRMDEQTVFGKGPIGVAKHAQNAGVPTVALVGGLGVDDAILHEAGIHAVLPICPYPMTLADALANADALVEQTALRLGYLLQLKN